MTCAAALLSAFCVRAQAQEPLRAATAHLAKIEGDKLATAAPDAVRRELRAAIKILEDVVRGDDRLDVAEVRRRCASVALSIVWTDGPAPVADTQLAVELWQQVRRYVERDGSNTKDWNVDWFLSYALERHVWALKAIKQTVAAQRALVETLAVIHRLPPAQAQRRRTESKRPWRLLDVAWQLAEDLSDHSAYETLCRGICDYLTQHPPARRGLLRAARGNLAIALGAQEKHDEALALMRQSLAEIQEEVGADSLEALQQRIDIGQTLDRKKDLREAVKEFEAVLTALRGRAGDDRDGSLLRQTRRHLAETLDRMAERERVRGLRKAVVESLSDRPPDDPDLLVAREEYAQSLAPPEAVVELRKLLATHERYGKKSDFNLHSVREQLGRRLYDLGHCDAGEALVKEALRGFQTHFPDVKSATWGPRAHLAWCELNRGNFDLAIRMQSQILQEATAGAPHSQDVLGFSVRLATMLLVAGETRDAKGLLERSMQDYVHHSTGTENRHVQIYRRAAIALARCNALLGDLAGAVAVLRDLLDAHIEALGPDNRAVQGLRLALAEIKLYAGDLPGAEVLARDAVAVRGRLPAGSVPRHRAELALASTLWRLGDDDRAKELLDGAIAGLEKNGATYYETQYARFIRARIHRQSGELDAAKADLDRLLAGFGRLSEVGESIPHLARAELGVLAWLRGDRDEARRRIEAAYRALREQMPLDLQHVGGLGIHRQLLQLLFEAGDGDALGARLKALIEDVLRRLKSARLLGSRARSEAVRELRFDLDVVLALGEHADPQTRKEEVVGLLESLRAVSTGGRPANRQQSHALDAPRKALVTAQRRLAAAVQRLQEADEKEREVFGLGKKFEAAQAAREKTELELIQAEAKARYDGGFTIDTDRVGNKLRNAAAIGYHVYRVHAETKGPVDQRVSTEHLLATIVRPDSSVAIVPLGKVATIETLVDAWRNALGEPVRGQRPKPATAGDTATAGRRLREVVWDTVLRSLGRKVSSLYLCLDGPLHLVPLDALPLSSGKLIGEEHHLVVLPSFAHLLAEPWRERRNPTLLAVGAVEFGESGAVAARSPADARPGGAHHFTRLTETLPEVEGIRKAHKARFPFGTAPELLTGTQATKERFVRLAPRANVLHLATHGFFADESFRSILDGDQAARTPAAILARNVIGFAPMTLCGLALAGANRGADAFGQVPGILTAEELSTLELGECYLAVLSACETNVGIRRAGQSVQSLQSALHAAGVKVAVTSLWKVPDTAAKTLMLGFYERLWSRERVAPADALWQAKMDLKTRGRPLSEWAGWVITGMSR